MIRQWCLVTTIVFSCSANADVLFEETARRFFEQLERDKCEVVYSSCKLHDGSRAVLVIPIGRATGMLFQAEDSSIANSATVVTKANVLTLDLSETQGGAYSFTELTNSFESLKAGTMRLGSGRQAQALLTSRTEPEICQHPYRGR